MYRKIEDFQKNWADETSATIKMLRNLTDESLLQKVSPSGRSLGFLAWHLVVTLTEMLAHTGLQIGGPIEINQIPASASEIADVYEKTANIVMKEVTENWTDETLLIEDNPYGETWKRGLTLLYLINHQTHHRGQMTVLMRQANLEVFGVAGPSKEEGEAMGMFLP